MLSRRCERVEESDWLLVNRKGDMLCFIYMFVCLFVCFETIHYGIDHQEYKVE